MAKRVTNSDNDSFDLSTIGGRIARARAQKGLSAAQLAQMVGRTRAAISLYEIGKNSPPTTMLTAMADALDVDVGWLTHGRSLVDLARFSEDLVGKQFIAPTILFPTPSSIPNGLFAESPNVFSGIDKAVTLNVSAPYFGLEEGDLLLLAERNPSICSDGSLYALSSSAGTVIVRSEPLINRGTDTANAPKELILASGQGQSHGAQSDALDVQGLVMGWIHRTKGRV